MKITRKNSDPAPNYNWSGKQNDSVRICPKCLGDGLIMGNPYGGFPYEMDCPLCDGYGRVMPSEND
jgi:DnaJ-class molecular chaperone